MIITIDNKTNEQELKFPCLMISKVYKIIVLFNTICKGVCIDSGNSPRHNIVGEYSYCYLMSNFIPFKGSITLSQH